jgi:hypothetical protein
MQLQTRLGPLEARATRDPQYPGIEIWLGDKMLVLVEVPDLLEASRTDAVIHVYDHTQQDPVMSRWFRANVTVLP